MNISVEIIVDSQTGETTIIDNRNFYECVDFQLKTIREKAAEIILLGAPEYKQRNAALGILPQQQINEIKNLIETTRNKSNQLEQQILAVTWDGKESTKTVACDTVQSISWS